MLTVTLIFDAALADTSIESLGSITSLPVTKFIESFAEIARSFVSYVTVELLLWEKVISVVSVP